MEGASVPCPICLEEADGGSFTLLTCGHIFCSRCIRTWAEKSTACPVCRAASVEFPASRMQHALLVGRSLLPLVLILAPCVEGVTTLWLCLTLRVHGRAMKQSYMETPAYLTYALTKSMIFIGYLTFTHLTQWQRLMRRRRREAEGRVSSWRTLMVQQQQQQQ
jgi:Ring finger domain